MAERDTTLLCHELLLRLAGRIPDERLWRYRDWLAGGAGEVLALSLPNNLIRDRIGLSDADHRLLSEALLPLGADPAAIDAVLPTEDRDAQTYRFTARNPTESTGDHEALVLGATLRGRPGVREVRTSWREDPEHATAQRVLLITTTSDPVTLTGEVQRIVRALGSHIPRVEVLPPGTDPPTYHRSALTNSEVICTGSADPAGQR